MTLTQTQVTKCVPLRDRTARLARDRLISFTLRSGAQTLTETCLIPVAGPQNRFCSLSIVQGIKVDNKNAAAVRAAMVRGKAEH